MKLYYSPGACSLASHIILKESGLNFEAIMASTKTHKLADGTDFYSLNELGYVPFLTLVDGSFLRESPAILQYIADQVPSKNLAPANGTFARYKTQEWLNFIATELHKNYSPLFNPNAPAEQKTAASARVLNRLEWVNKQLGSGGFLVNSDFNIADAYLFTVLGWNKLVNIDTSSLQNLVDFQAKVAARPAVQAALKAEGLLK